MTTFLTVLKSGGGYDERHVVALARSVAQHGTAFDRIVALTDLPLAIEGVDVVPLLHDWPGWWSKIEAFRADLGDDRRLVCDLDTIVAGSIDPFAEPGLMALEDHFHKGRVSSALMRWEGASLAFVYETFAADAARFMTPGSCGEVPNAVHGDQVVIDHLLRREGAMPEFAQVRYPALIDFYDDRRGIIAPLTIFIGETKPVLADDGELLPPSAHATGMAAC